MNYNEEEQEKRMRVIAQNGNEGYHYGKNEKDERWDLARFQLKKGCPTHQDYSDEVEQPKHYNSHPSGIECIDIVQHMGFNLGNVIKYVWRADLKGKDIQDLEKAKKYLEFEIKKREK